MYSSLMSDYRALMAVNLPTRQLAGMPASGSCSPVAMRGRQSFTTAFWTPVSSCFQNHLRSIPWGGRSSRYYNTHTDTAARRYLCGIDNGNVERDLPPSMAAAAFSNRSLVPTSRSATAMRWQLGHSAKPDRLGRRPLLITSCIGYAVLGYPFFVMAASGSVGLAIVAQLLTILLYVPVCRCLSGFLCRDFPDAGAV